MPDPLPLSPDSPDVEVVEGPVAALLRALCAGSLNTIIDLPPAIPRPKAITWKDLQLDCGDASWVVDAGELNLELRRPRFGGDKQLDKMFRVMNHSADFKLDGRGSLTARLAHLVRRGNQVNLEKRVAMTTYTISLNSWTWWPPSEKALWVGRINGPRIRDGNMVVCGEQEWTSVSASRPAYCRRANGLLGDLHRAGTVMKLSGLSSSSGASLARVASQYLGASSR